MGGDGKLCAILNIEAKGNATDHLEVYRIPLLDFEVRRPATLSMPLAMDFGTTNTTAGGFQLYR